MTGVPTTGIDGVCGTGVGGGVGCVAVDGGGAVTDPPALNTGGIGHYQESVVEMEVVLGAVLKD